MHQNSSHKPLKKYLYNASSSSGPINNRTFLTCISYFQVRLAIEPTNIKIHTVVNRMYNRCMEDRKVRLLTGHISMTLRIIEKRVYHNQVNLLDFHPEAPPKADRYDNPVLLP